MRFCQSCGAELPERAAFCVQCGASTSAPAQAAPGASTPEPTAPIPGGEPTAVIPPAPYAAPPADAPEGSVPDKKSKKALLLSSGAIVVVAAIVVGLLFVLGVFKSDKGSPNPQDAVAQLVNSVVARTPDKAFNAVAPGEIAGFQGLAKAATSPSLKSALTKFQNEMKSSSGGSSILGALGPQFAALQSISNSDVTSALKAVTVKVDNLKYTTTNLADGIADVTVTNADVTVSADSSKIPSDVKKKLSTIVGSSSDVPSWVNDLLTGDTKISHTWKLSDYQNQVDESGQKVDLIVVKQDGGWYVSLYGTIAQHVYEGVVQDRKDNGGAALAQPDWKAYANPPKPIVAGAPEQVPANFVKAVNDKSVKEIFQNLPQSEVRALYPYVSLLQTAMDQSSSSSDTGKLDVSGVQATTTGTDGDLVHVTYTQGTATETKNGNTKTASVANGCYTVDSSKQCVADWPDFAQTLAKVFGIDKGIPLTLRKVDGGYQADPIGTYVGYVSAAMNHADDLVTAYGQFMTWFQKQMEAFSSSLGSSSGSSCYDASGNYTC